MQPPFLPRSVVVTRKLATAHPSTILIGAAAARHAAELAHKGQVSAEAIARAVTMFDHLLRSAIGSVSRPDLDVSSK